MLFHLVKKKVLSGALMCGLAISSSAYAMSVETLEDELLNEIAYKVDASEVNVLGMRIHIAETNQNLMSLSALKAVMPLGARLELSHLEATERDQRFAAVLELHKGSSDAAPQVISISGKYDVMREVPVLRQAMFRDDIVREDDLQWIAVPDRSIRPHHVRDASMLVGKMLTRRITANRPLRARDVVAERKVNKGDMVAMIYKTKHMLIKTVGKATEDGALNDVIAVKNIDSGKTIRGMVTENGHIHVNFGQSLLTEVALAE